MPIVPGECVSPAGLYEAYERGLKAAAVEATKPTYDGEVNGVRLVLFDQPDEDTGSSATRCDGGKVKGFQEFSGLSFGYLPPGMAPVGPQMAAICDNGSVMSFGQQFVANNTSFDIWFESGAMLLRHDASADRVAAGVVAGRPAVIIRPITEEGFGRIWVAQVMANGLLTLDARMMLLDEALKIAEGIEYGSC